MPTKRVSRKLEEVVQEAAISEAPIGTETDMYFPEDQTVKVTQADGVSRKFRIGVMRIGPSLRFTRLLGRLVMRSERVITMLNEIPDDAQKDATLRQFDWFSLLREDDLVSLLMIVLGNDPTNEPDEDWITTNWNLSWVFDAVDKWLDCNPLADYLGKIQRMVTRVRGEMNTKTQARA